MGDIIEIIIILFFILSAFGGIFKKKKQQRQEMEQKPPSPKPSSEKTKDVFEELFGVKFPEEEETQVETTRYETQTEETWDPETEFFGEAQKVEKPEPPRIERKKPKIEPQYKPSWKQINYDKLNRQEVKELQKEEIDIKELVKSKLKINKRANEIRNKLKNQNSIREFIVISEILNKPKALRR